ncbi:hypothetical protein [Streptomyces sp. CMB-StM0423]|uniref:hypothetical protein n=1 Tax=Streptomyces sp. CMB-StM0423 TaxID=2059884 RepID=UPI00131E6B49|nr:hypothetical protein [Streptomyces sp. CMB-StM0423]
MRNELQFTVVAEAVGGFDSGHQVCGRQLLSARRRRERQHTLRSSHTGDDDGS